MNDGRWFAAALTVAVCLLVFAPSVQAADLPEHPGVELVRTQCGDCHSTQRVAEQSLSRENWEGLLKDMRHFGADFSDQERQSLLAYLGTYLSPERHGSVEVLPAGEGRDLVRGVCSACHNIALVKQQRLSEWQWEEVLDDMTKFGAPLDDTTRPIILKYLVTHLGQ